MLSSGHIQFFWQGTVDLATRASKGSFVLTPRRSANRPLSLDDKDCFPSAFASEWNTGDKLDHRQTASHAYARRRVSPALFAPFCAHWLNDFPLFCNEFGFLRWMRDVCRSSLGYCGYWKIEYVKVPIFRRNRSRASLECFVGYLFISLCAPHEVTSFSGKHFELYLSQSSLKLVFLLLLALEHEFGLFMGWIELILWNDLRGIKPWFCFLPLPWLRYSPSYFHWSC